MLRRRAPVQELERQAEIGGEDEIAVGRGGVGDGAEMDHGVELAAVEPGAELAGRHHVGEAALAEIAPFARVAERIVDHDVGAPGLVEAGDQIGSDEPGPAGDQQHPHPRPACHPSPFASGRPGCATSASGSVTAGGYMGQSWRTGQACQGQANGCPGQSEGSGAHLQE